MEIRMSWKGVERERDRKTNQLTEMKKSGTGGRERETDK